MLADSDRHQHPVHEVPALRLLVLRAVRAGHDRLAGRPRRAALQRRLHRRHAAPDPHSPRRCTPTRSARRPWTTRLRGVELQQMTGENRDEFLIRLSAHEGRPRTGRSTPSPPSAMRSLAAHPGHHGRAAPHRDGRAPRSAASCAQKAIWAIFSAASGDPALRRHPLRVQVRLRRGGRAVPRRVRDAGLRCRSPDREVSLTVVAALLTIAGYSINDTIVVFDRIRERIQGASQGEALAGHGHRGQRDAVAHRSSRRSRCSSPRSRCSSGAARCSATSRSRCWSASCSAPTPRSTWPARWRSIPSSTWSGRRHSARSSAAAPAARAPGWLRRAGGRSRR